MATNFVITKGNSSKREPSNYIIEREYKKERREVMALEKELREHEKTDAAHAHPMHRSHERKSQKSAGIPSLRK